MLIGVDTDLFDKNNKTKEEIMVIDKFQMYCILSNIFELTPKGEIKDNRQLAHAKAYSKQYAGYSLTESELNDIAVWEEILKNREKKSDTVMIIEDHYNYDNTIPCKEELELYTDL